MVNDKNCINYDNNFDLLIKLFCAELKKKDKNKNGLITHKTFIEVLDMFQIEYDTPIIDYLMKYCVVTEDGFINYKNLLLIHDPSKALKNISECVQEIFNPQFMYMQDKYEDNDKYVQEKNEIIRKLYSQWDKCLLKDDEFKAKLINNNVDITPEFERSLYLYGPSRSLSFVNVMKTLYINNSKNRKNRTTFLNKMEDDKSSKLSVDENSQECFKQIHRNPITWDQSRIKDSDKVVESVEIISNHLMNNNNNTTNKEMLPRDFINDTIKNIIKKYIANKISDCEFCEYLSKLNISVTPELSNLIKYHELDNNGKFKDFVTAINRCMKKNVSHCLERNKALNTIKQDSEKGNLNYTFNKLQKNDLLYSDINNN
ncbi:conserved protein, unknown function [Plasmodium yoelii]|uniref:EF-hand domain-containing protein n=3 Tax=Plasmodium yoelii TaxID=5861 RepID=A0AAE9WQA8_PLAYO|nr:conserved protein, unknown function [Plasmodium yoelii]WBY54544.1 hypothetical protein Py17XNL_000104773 [Plasmodium yoelii yoelii]CDU15943.1 conserved Plasmodium protein, unknown function [Plasmodium yoelii]VTZ71538.1 conserved protein, unknown function [Plasmodium yoelii]|eukprot:XP_730867.2 conserved protein, unknown function [Plasmodium yoelii]